MCCLFAACTPTFVVPSKVDTSNKHCRYMEEVCNDLEQFERSYAHMDDESRREMATIRLTLQQQCADAAKRCKKASKKH
ncbi:MAG: hypothetical protein GF398_13595 [Chitinivibrionales bacterium]|nr:hypothetical protein [Chitinivibrionales bacterium]